MENSLQSWHEGTYYYSIWEYFYNAVESNFISDIPDLFHLF